MNLSESGTNHLIRLLGWLSCEIGGDTDEIIAVAKDLEIRTRGDIELQSNLKPELERQFNESFKCPGYIRTAIKQLNKEIAKHQSGSVVNADFSEVE